LKNLPCLNELKNRLKNPKNCSLICAENMVGRLQMTSQALYRKTQLTNRFLLNPTPLAQEPYR
jgi:hypothetical protein